MAKLSEKELSEWENKRDLNAELLQALHDMKRGEWARKTDFTPQPDGTIRRMILRRDGWVWRDAVIGVWRDAVIYFSIGLPRGMLISALTPHTRK
jgi:hypothetical protein